MLLGETNLVELWDELDDIFVGASSSAEDDLSGGNVSSKETVQSKEEFENTQPADISAYQRRLVVWLFYLFIGKVCMFNRV